MTCSSHKLFPISRTLLLLFLITRCAEKRGYVCKITIESEVDPPPDSGEDNGDDGGDSGMSPLLLSPTCIFSSQETCLISPF